MSNECIRLSCGSAPNATTIGAREGRDVAFRNMLANALLANPDFPMPIDHTLRRAVRLAYRLERLSDVKSQSEMLHEQNNAQQLMNNVSEQLSSIYGSMHAAILALALPLGEIQQGKAKQEFDAAVAIPFTTEDVREAVEAIKGAEPPTPGLLDAEFNEPEPGLPIPQREGMSPYSRGWADLMAGNLSREDEEAALNRTNYLLGWAEARLARIGSGA